MFFSLPIKLYRRIVASDRNCTATSSSSSTSACVTRYQLFLLRSACCIELNNSSKPVTTQHFKMHCARCLSVCCGVTFLDDPLHPATHQYYSTAQFNDTHFISPSLLDWHQTTIVLHGGETNEDTDKNQLQHDDLAARVKLRSRSKRREKGSMTMRFRVLTFVYVGESVDASLINKRCIDPPCRPALPG